MAPTLTLKHEAKGGVLMDVHVGDGIGDKEVANGHIRKS